MDSKKTDEEDRFEDICGSTFGLSIPLLAKTILLFCGAGRRKPKEA